MVEYLAFFLPGIIMGLLMIKVSFWHSWCWFWSSMLSGYLVLWGLPLFSKYLTELSETNRVIALQAAYIIVLIALIVIFMFIFGQCGPEAGEKIRFPKIIERIGGFIAGFSAVTTVVAVLFLLSTINMPFYKEWATQERYEFAKKVLFTGSKIVDLLAHQNSYLHKETVTSGGENEEDNNSKTTLLKRRNQWYDELISEYMIYFHRDSSTSAENKGSGKNSDDNTDCKEDDTASEPSRAVLNTQRSISVNPKRVASKATKAAAKNQSAVAKLSK